MSYPVARRSERKPIRVAVILLIEGEEVDHHALTVDLSRHGVRLQTNPALTVGQFAQVIFEDNPSHPVPSRVVWAGPVGSDRETEAGLEFVNPLPTSQ